MEYKYRITLADDSSDWIYIHSNDDTDCDSTDSFVALLKMICTDTNGKIEEVGDYQYKIKGDGIGLIYQWDSCFGIVAVRPPEISKTQAIKFLSRYMSDFVTYS